MLINILYLGFGTSINRGSKSQGIFVTHMNDEGAAYYIEDEKINELIKFL